MFQGLKNTDFTDIFVEACMMNLQQTKNNHIS